MEHIINWKLKKNFSDQLFDWLNFSGVTPSFKWKWSCLLRRTKLPLVQERGVLKYDGLEKNLITS